MKNLRNFVLKKLATLIGNKMLKKRFAHLNMSNLLRLRLYGLFLTFKLARHYNHPEKAGV